MEATDIGVVGVCGGAETVKSSPEQKPNENFTVDDLLDFPNDDVLISDEFFDEFARNSTDSSTGTAVDSCNSSVSGSENQFSSNLSQFNGDLCVPYDDLAELEWLSNFVEDSFSNQTDLNNLHLITGSKPPTPESSSSETQLTPITRITPIFKPKSSLPGKARSKRSRAAPCDWSTRLLHLASLPPETAKMQPRKKRETSNADYTGRKCVHCASEKTPQWRTGPMGPKTLCNACGVRYKSGRLVPEYRPAASPTFALARHSNSHRKVMELRRQKEMQTTIHNHHHHHHHHHPPLISQSSIFGISDGGDDFLIHHHNGHDYRQLI